MTELPLNKHQSMMTYSEEHQARAAAIERLIEADTKLTFFDAMVNAHRHRTGEFRSILGKALKWGTEQAERPARERIAARRRQEQ